MIRLSAAAVARVTPSAERTAQHIQELWRAGKRASCFPLVASHRMGLPLSPPPLISALESRVKVTVTAEMMFVPDQIFFFDSTSQTCRPSGA